MGARLRRWSIHGLPTLAVMAVVMALYLAPTKDDDATALVLYSFAVAADFGSAEAGGSAVAGAAEGC